MVWLGFLAGLLLHGSGALVIGIERLVPSQYSYIQDAIDAADDGDVITVSPGTYYENLSISGTFLTIQSTNPEDPGQTIIDGSSYGVTTVAFYGYETDYCILRGFTITGASDSGIQCYYGGPTIEKCIIEGNTGNYDSGGIWIYEGYPYITNCTIRNNTAYGCGGGVYMYDSCPMIRHSMIVDNHADEQGGGIGIQRYDGWYPHVRNCVLAGNYAGYEGGAIYGYCDDPYTDFIHLVNCTLADNDSYRGGGIYNDGEGYSQATNSIVWGNLSIYEGGQIYSEPYGGSDLQYCDVEGNGASGSNIDQDPRFVPDDDYYHLTPSSPCINAGDPASDYSQEPHGGEGRINMGAYGNTAEAAVLDSDGDELPDSWEVLHWPGDDPETLEERKKVLEQFRSEIESFK